MLKKLFFIIVVLIIGVLIFNGAGTKVNALDTCVLPDIVHLDGEQGPVIASDLGADSIIYKYIGRRAPYWKLPFGFITALEAPAKVGHSPDAYYTCNGDNCLQQGIFEPFMGQKKLLDLEPNHGIRFVSIDIGAIAHQSLLADGIEAVEILSTNGVVQVIEYINTTQSTQEIIYQGNNESIGLVGRCTFIKPVPTPTSTSTPTMTPAFTSTVTSTLTPTPTLTPVPLTTATITPTKIPVLKTSTATSTSTFTPVLVVTPNPTENPIQTPTATPTLTSTSTIGITPTVKPPSIITSTVTPTLTPTRLVTTPTPTATIHHSMCYPPPVVPVFDDAGNEVCPNPLPTVEQIIIIQEYIYIPVVGSN